MSAGFAFFSSNHADEVLFSLVASARNKAKDKLSWAVRLGFGVRGECRQKLHFCFRHGLLGASLSILHTYLKSLRTRPSFF